jgi:hypothetical protein
MCKEVVVAYFEVIFWNLPGGTKENHRKCKSEEKDYV